MGVMDVAPEVASSSQLASVNTFLWRCQGAGRSAITGAGGRISARILDRLAGRQAGSDGGQNQLLKGTGVFLLTGEAAPS